MVGKAHPNCFEIVEVFKKEQASAEVTLAQLASGALPVKHTRRAVARDRHIDELKQQFRDNAITLQEYVSAISLHANL